MSCIWFWLCAFMAVILIKWVAKTENFNLVQRSLAPNTKQTLVHYLDSPLLTFTLLSSSYQFGKNTQKEHRSRRTAPKFEDDFWTSEVNAAKKAHTNDSEVLENMFYTCCCCRFWVFLSDGHPCCHDTVHGRSFVFVGQKREPWQYSYSGCWRVSR